MADESGELQRRPIRVLIDEPLLAELNAHEEVLAREGRQSCGGRFGTT